MNFDGCMIVGKLYFHSKIKSYSKDTFPYLELQVLLSLRAWLSFTTYLQNLIWCEYWKVTFYVGCQYKTVNYRLFSQNILINILWQREISGQLIYRFQVVWSSVMLVTTQNIISVVQHLLLSIRVTRRLELGGGGLFLKFKVPFFKKEKLFTTFKNWVLLTMLNTCFAEFYYAFSRNYVYFV